MYGGQAQAQDDVNKYTGILNQPVRKAGEVKDLSIWNIKITFLPKGSSFSYRLVYITTTVRNTVLYTGVTSNLIGRMYDHKTKADPKSFTAKYNVDKLVFYEVHPTIKEAIAREKEIKGWVHAKKIKLIESMNTEWRDLYDDILDW